MSDELKPVRCGCGGEAEVIKHTFHGASPSYGVACRKCRTESWQFFETEAEAVTAWNKTMGERTAKVEVLYRDESVIFGHCECGQAVNTYSIYCHKCGAKLDWSGNE